MATTWTPTTEFLGIQPILQTSTVQNHPWGMVVKAYDSVLGEGEFIYLPGVASTVIGSLVTWNIIDKTTTLVPNTAKLGYPVAVAMAANIVATTYGWYQISGVALIIKSAAAIAKGARVAISATTATILGTSTAGKFINGAIAANSTVSATTFAKVLINRPFMENIAT